MYRIAFRLFCVLLLLAGQAAALTHALSHVQDRLARVAPATAHDEAPRQQDKPSGERFALCDFDYAYSQVLGGVHANAPSCPASDAGHAYSAALASTTRVAPFLAPYSRGPPARS